MEMDPEPPTSAMAEEEEKAQLDKSIEKLLEEYEMLKEQLNTQCMILLAQPWVQKMLREEGCAEEFGLEPDDPNPIEGLTNANASEYHRIECLYRMCAGVTGFKVKDPDPNAVDDGNILGIRFDIMTGNRFNPPYYFMVNRPYPENPDFFRVHRHTVPACIPVSALAARYLPPPGKAGKKTRVEQDLQEFVRQLRFELNGYHGRLFDINLLRKCAGLEKEGEVPGAGTSGETTDYKTKEIGEEERDDEDDYEGLDEDGNPIPKPRVVNIMATDAEAKHITFEWSDGRSGRLVVDRNCKILKMVAMGEKGRDRKLVRELLGGAKELEDICPRLQKARAKSTD